jgi:hypothetical protein
LFIRRPFFGQTGRRGIDRGGFARGNGVSGRRSVPVSALTCREEVDSSGADHVFGSSPPPPMPTAGAPAPTTGTEQGSGSCVRSRGSVAGESALRSASVPGYS